MFDIKPINLRKGSHGDTATTGQGCFMNVIAYLNGESQITDQSPCVCPTIRPIAIWANDFADDEQRQRLLPFVLRAMGSATEDRTELSRRLEKVVKYAEFNARLADSFAKSAAGAVVPAAWSARSAAEAARSAAEAARSAAEAAWSAAEAAEAWSAAGSAAAWSAAAEYEARKESLFQAALDFLDEVCPPIKPYDSIILERAEKLISLSHA